MRPRNFQYERCRRFIGAATAVVLITATTAGVALGAGGSGGIDSDGTSGGEAPVTGSTEGVFPIRGKHSYGDGLGAGRGHQGQDLLAKCGKAVVSAQPGRVQTNEYHGAAGNYVVIDGKGAIEDMVYMHLQSRSAIREGQRVDAGDELGRVGDTGSASACHLHFELWSNPGYYEGGEPLDPAPSLKRWDSKRK